MHAYALFSADRPNDKKRGTGEENRERERERGGLETRSFANNYYCSTHRTGCLRDMYTGKRVPATRNRLRENRKAAGIRE